MIHSLTLGNRTFPVNLIQGPLAGVSCSPFRALTWRYSKPAFSCTEMISCKTLLQTHDKLRHRYIHKDPAEGPVCFQLSGSDPVELGEAARIATDLGADLLDLNCGCPVKKIRSKGAGSRLLTQPEKLYQLISAMKQHSSLPVSIKIRVESQQEQFNRTVAQVVQDAGADFLVVHGRHWTEHYETPCRHDDIAFFVDALSIPVIGNGDIADVASLKQMLATACAGVMIGRAGVGQPWLIRQLMAQVQGEAFQRPQWSEIGAVYLEHVQMLAQLLGNDKAAVFQARQLAKYYARQLPQQASFVAAVNQCASLPELDQVINTV